MEDNDSYLIRTRSLIGEECLNRLWNAHVAIFGIGGVGGYVAEALVRSGIRHFDLIDHDKVSISNLNRQIIATRDSIGKYKVDVMKERMKSINPQVEVEVFKCFFLPENASEFNFKKYDYVVDAVDTVTAKLTIIQEAKFANVPVISCMGTGNKINPGCFEVADISKTSVCPLAKVMRRELKKRSITNVKVVYSKEKPIKTSCYEMRETLDDHEENAEEWGIREDMHRNVPGSISFVPATAGLILAGELIRDLIKYQEIKL